MLWAHPCALVATIHDLAMFHIAKKYRPGRGVFMDVCRARPLARRQDAIIAAESEHGRDIEKFFRLPAAASRPLIRITAGPRAFVPGSRAEAKRRAEGWSWLRQPFFLYIARLETRQKITSA